MAYGSKVWLKSHSSGAIQCRRSYQILKPRAGSANIFEWALRVYGGNLSNLISREEERNREEHITPLTGMEIPVRDWQAEIKRWAKERGMMEARTLLVHYLVHTKINWDNSFLLCCLWGEDGKSGFCKKCCITLLSIINSVLATWARQLFTVPMDLRSVPRRLQGSIKHR